VLAQQLGVGYAAPGTWPHAARDWRGGRVVFPHTTPEGRLVNLYGRAVGTEEQVPKGQRHDHLPGAKGYFNAPALQASTDPLWVCEGAFDALALLAAGVPRVMAIYGVQGWRWDWVRDVRALVFALDADTAGQQQWQALARQAALRGKRVEVLESEAYGGQKDVSAAWAAGVLGLDGGAADVDDTLRRCVTQERWETWMERVSIMVVDGGLPLAEAEHCALRAGTGQAAEAGREDGRQRNTNARRHTPKPLREPPWRTS
jgi:hypothetical protein